MDSIANQFSHMSIHWNCIASLVILKKIIQSLAVLSSFHLLKFEIKKKSCALNGATVHY